MTPAALLFGFGLFILIVFLGVVMEMPEMYRRYPPPPEAPEAQETPVPARAQGALTELELENLQTEHRTLPQFALGRDPSHCDQCKQVHEIRQRQAACSHDGDYAEMHSADGTLCMRVCNECGASLED